MRYDATMASGQVEAYYQEGDQAMRASLDGALAYVDGHAGLTRQQHELTMSSEERIKRLLKNLQLGVATDEGRPAAAHGTWPRAR